MLSLKTGQSAFLPLPRHMYGEMARTSQGRDLLAQREVVATLLTELEKYETAISMYTPVSFASLSSSRSRAATHQSDQESMDRSRGKSQDTDQSQNHSPPPTADVISALWALGHISAIEDGFQSILSVSPRFVPSCIALATDALSYSVRSCAFSVLGLISRTESGSMHLAANHWQAAPIHYVAVAMPDDPSVLFRYQEEGDGDVEAAGEGGSDSDFEDKVPFSVDVDALRASILENSTPGSTPRGVTNKKVMAESPSCSQGGGSAEGKLLEAIGRLPGQLLYKDTLAIIKDMKRVHPEVFNCRAVYLSVHHLLAMYTFKLGIRRLLLDLFTTAAKKNAVGRTECA